MTGPCDRVVMLNDFSTIRGRRDIARRGPGARACRRRAGGRLLHRRRGGGRRRWRGRNRCRRRPASGPAWPGQRGDARALRSGRGTARVGLHRPDRYPAHRLPSAWLVAGPVAGPFSARWRRWPTGWCCTHMTFRWPARTSSISISPASRTCDRTPLSAGCMATNCDKRSYAQKLWRTGRHGVQRRPAGRSAPDRPDRRGA